MRLCLYKSDRSQYNVTVVHMNPYQGISPWYNQFREAAGSVPNGMVARGNMGLLSQWISGDFCLHDINIYKLHTALLQVTKKSYTQSCYMIKADMWSTMKLSILGNIDLIYTCQIEVNLLLIWGLFVIWEVNGWAFEVWEWISNFIPHFIGYMITYPCWD